MFLKTLRKIRIQFGKNITISKILQNDKQNFNTLIYDNQKCNLILVFRTKPHNQPLGSLAPSEVNFSGSFRQVTTSFNSSLASSTPHTSLNLILEDCPSSCGWNLPLLGDSPSLSLMDLYTVYVKRVPRPTKNIVFPIPGLLGKYCLRICYIKLLLVWFLCLSMLVVFI